MSKRLTKNTILKARRNEVGAVRDLPWIGEGALPEPGSFLQSDTNVWLVVDAEKAANGIEGKVTTIRFDPQRLPKEAKIYDRGFMSFEEMRKERGRLLEKRSKHTLRATR